MTRIRRIFTDLFVSARIRIIRANPCSITSQASAEDLCRYFTTEMAKALKSNGADNIKRLHVRVDEGIEQGTGCEFDIK